MQYIITKAYCEIFRQNDTWHLGGINLPGSVKEFIYLKQCPFSLLFFFLFLFLQPSQPFRILTSINLPLMGWFICSSELVFPELRDTGGVSQQSSWISDYIASLDSMLQKIFFHQQDGVSHTFHLTN